MKKYFDYFKGASIAILSVFTLTAFAAWNEPASAPPGGNVSAPIHVGPETQTKNGTLTVGPITGTGAGLNVQRGISYFGLSSEGVGLNTKGIFYGNVWADKYCDRSGANCKTSSEMGGGGSLPTYYTVSGTSNSISCNVGDVAIGYVHPLDGNHGFTYSNFQGGASTNPRTINFTDLDGQLKTILCSTAGSGTGGSGGGSDELVKSTVDDTTAGYLINELTAGSGISISQSGSGDKKITISATGGGGGGGGLPAGFYALPFGSYGGGNDYSRINDMKLSRILKEGIVIVRNGSMGSSLPSGSSVSARVFGGRVQTRVITGNAGACDSGWVDGNFAANGMVPTPGCTATVIHTCAAASYQGLTAYSFTNGGSCPPTSTPQSPLSGVPFVSWESY